MKKLRGRIIFIPLRGGCGASLGLFFCGYLSSVTLANKEVHVNAIELARHKFNALFAAHDAKDKREAAKRPKLALNMAKKPARQNGKPK